MPLLQFISDCSQVHGVLDDVEIILCGGERRELHDKIERINRGGERNEERRLRNSRGCRAELDPQAPKMGKPQAPACTPGPAQAAEPPTTRLLKTLHTHTHTEKEVDFKIFISKCPYLS